MMQINSKYEYVYLSYLKCISTIGVVYLHLNGVFWIFSYDKSWVVSNIIESFFYFSVPVFFMITGATLLDFRKKYRIEVFFSKRIKKVVIPYIFFFLAGLIYLVLQNYIAADTNIFSFFVTKFFSGGIVDYYWFIPPLLTVYILIPIFNPLSKSDNKKLLLYTIVILFIFNSLLPYLTKVGFQVYSLHVGPLGSEYMFYVFAGYYLHKYKISSASQNLLILFSMISVMMHLFGTIYFSYSIGEVSNIFKGYLTPFTVFYSLGIFVFIKNLSYKKINNCVGNLVNFINNYSFMIYMLHYFFKDIIENFYFINEFSVVYKLIAPIFVILSCVLLTFISRKSKLLRLFFT